METLGVERVSGSSYEMPGVYNVTMKPLNSSSTSLTCTWESTGLYGTTLQFYQSTTNSTLRGLPIGNRVSVSAGITTYTSPTLTIIDGLYYYALITRSSNNIVKSNTTIIPHINNVVIAPLIYSSTGLSVTWTTVSDFPTTVTYYKVSTDSTSGGVSIGSHPISAGIYTDNLRINLEANQYYYVNVSQNISNNTTSPTSVFMPGVYNVAIIQPLHADTQITVTWQVTTPYAVTVDIWEVKSTVPTGGTRAGSRQTISAGTLNYSLLYTPKPSYYYYAIVTPLGGIPAVSSIAVGIVDVFNVSINNLTLSSRYLTANWSVNPTSSRVTVNFYSSNSPSTSVGTLRETATSTESTLNSLTISLVAGTYYFVGVQQGDGNEVRGTALQMPGLISIAIGDLTDGSTTLSSSWSIAGSYTVIVRYYQVGSPNVQVGTDQIVTDTTSNTLFITPVKGKSYYVVATISGGNTVTSSTVLMPLTVPGAPTGVSGTPGKLYEINLSWTAPSDNGGSSITSYTVITYNSYPSSIFSTKTDISGSLTSTTIAGLVTGTPYIFTVTAINIRGSSLPSSPSASMAPASAPQAPSYITTFPGDGTATSVANAVTVSWNAPIYNGGSAITGYTVISNPVTTTLNSTTESVVFTGLTNGGVYTFTVTATNAVGTSSGISSYPITVNTLAGSLSFDGSSNYLSLTPGISVGTGAFTVEGWFYNKTSFVNAPILGSSSSSSESLTIVFRDSNSIIVSTPSGNYNQLFIFPGGFSVSLNKWHHIAIVADTRKVSNMYIDGVYRAPYTTIDYNFSGISDLVGRNASGYWPGYITNYRFVLGSAVYYPGVGIISLPSAPLLAIPGTQYLMLGDNVTTDTSNTQTVTNNGVTKSNTYRPF